MSKPVDLIVTKEAREELRAAIEDMREFNKLILESVELAKTFSKGGVKSPLPSNANDSAKNYSKWLSDINAKYEESERLATNVARKKAQLAEAESDNAKELAKLREETRQVNAALKEEGILSSKLVGEYKKLETSRNKAARQLRDLIASEKASNAELRRAQKEFDRLDNKVREANRATRNFRDNVGNYTSALSKASFAFRTFLGVLGLYSAKQIAEDIFEQVKALDGLNLALQQVTESQNEYIETQEFLRDLAEEAGAEIFGLTSAYTKFLASAKATNLTTDQTQNIFRQVAKAAGILGLSTEATNGAFRALEQILSKGKVQAEEIRGQLAERLPGAFQILAKSMGLTTTELSKQLELGNVLSDEVLPGFAEELSKTYSLETVKRVETMAAAQVRLGNAWKEFIANVEGGEGKISKVFKGMFETLTKAIEFFDDLNKGPEKLREEFLKGLRSERMQEELADLQIEAYKSNNTLQNTARLVRSKFTFAVSDAQKEVERLKNSVENANKKIAEGGDESEAYSNELEFLNKDLEAAENNLAQQEGRLDAVNKILKVVTKSTREYSQEEKKKIPTLKGSIAYYEQLIKKLEEQRSKLALNRVEYKHYTDAIEEAEAALLRLIALYTNQKVELVNPVGSEEAIKAAQDIYKQLEEYENSRAAKAKEINDAIKKNEEDKAKFRVTLQKYVDQQIADSYKNVFSTFEQYYDLDLSLFQNLLEKKKVGLDDYANFAKSSIQAITDSRIISYENELAQKRYQLEQIEASEETTEKQKAIARKKYAKEEQEIRIKQAKAQRNSILLQIAVDTAAAIAKILTTAAVLSSNPLTAPFAPNAFAQAAIAAGVGAAQAAFVLAQPLPKYARGVENAPEGFAITDENGAELHLDKNNKIKSIGSEKGARLNYMEKGDTIIPANKTKQIINSAVSKNDSDIQDKIDMWLMRAIYQEPKTPVISTAGMEGIMKRGLNDVARALERDKYITEY